MHTDSFPLKDADFNNWLIPFQSYVGLQHVLLGLDIGTISALSAASTAWTSAYTAIQNPDTTTSTTIRLKNEARTALETVLRPIINQIQANPAVTDDMRTRMGINIPSHTHTAVPVPATAPLCTVGSGQHLAHLLDFRDAATPAHRGKPPGVHGCEIRAKVGGAAPASIAELVQMATDTATPQQIQYDVAQAGLTVYCRLRWVNPAGQAGPWSDLATAIIPS
jgi:hypothetical protein